MKKLLIAAVLIVLPITVAFAQTFTFTRPSTQNYTYSSDTIEIIDTGRVTVSGGPIQLRLIRTSTSVPTGWETAMCDISSCYPPFVDSAMANYPNGVNEVTMHFYHHHINGQGTMTVRCERVSNPSQFVTVIFKATNIPLGIKQISSIVKDFSLEQNYPNPFNPNTKINFAIPKTDHISLRVYDILGREVRVLINEDLTQGEYEYDFDAKGLSSGMYYYSLRAGEYVSVKKMVLVK